MRDKSLPALPEAFRKLLIKAFGGSASNVYKGMATLALGSGMAKLIGIAAIPILTRLYSPEDFGVLAVFTALISILAPLLTLRYVLSLPLPRHDGVALNLLALSVGLMLLTSTLVAIILWVFGESILTAVSMEVLVPWWWLIILGLFATACYEMLTLWATRKRSYGVIAKTSVWQSFTGSFAKIALGLLALKPFGLLFGQVIAQGGGAGFLLKNFNNDFKKNWRHVRWSRMIKAAWQHRGFPLFRVPSQFLLIAAQQAPLLFVASFYGIAAAGQLAVAKMLVSMPVKFVSGALTKAAYGELASIGKNNILEIHAIFNDVTKKLFILSCVACAAVFSMAPIVLPTILGGEWSQAGIFASYLSIYLVATIVAVPMPAFVNVFNKQKEFLAWNAIRLFLVIILISVAFMLQALPEIFVLAYGVLMLAFQFGVVARVALILRVKAQAAHSEPQSRENHQ